MGLGGRRAPLFGGLSLSKSGERKDKLCWRRQQGWGLQGLVKPLDKIAVSKEVEAQERGEIG